MHHCLAEVSSCLHIRSMGQEQVHHIETSEKNCNVQWSLDSFSTAIYVSALGQKESQHLQVGTLIVHDRPVKNGSVFAVKHIHVGMVFHQPLGKIEVAVERGDLQWCSLAAVPINRFGILEHLPFDRINFALLLLRVLLT